MNKSFFTLLSLLACYAVVQGQISTVWSTQGPTPSASPYRRQSNQPTNSMGRSYNPSSATSNVQLFKPSVTPSETITPATLGLPSDLPSLVSLAVHSDTDRPYVTSDPPSIVPSDFPSTVPSIDPTISPTGKPSFSNNPSSTPTTQPSRTPISSPSFAPTSLPSSTASANPSTMPSDIPSLLPSFKPSTQPSETPSVTPSTFPSSTPTFSPSTFPTSSPSVPPTANPTAAPTSAPSVSPSQTPTSAPSPSPSASPTVKPTAQPTAQPSSSPSFSPSANPTEECHDVASYSSPINGFSCADHEGTECTQWRFLGLSFSEVEELIDSCPVSCNVECGTSLRFETVYSFKLWNINKFLSPYTVSTMNEVAADFFTEYVSDRELDATFFLYETVLLSQQFANSPPTRSLRSLQNLGSSSNSLLVDVEFRGYGIGLDKVTIDTLLRDGLFSPDYTLALQRSGDPTFKETQVGAVDGTRPTQSVSEESSRSASPGGITAAILGSAAIFAAVGFYFYRTKNTNDKNTAFMRENQILFNNFPTSPNQSVLSPASSFSFDGASNMVSRMARIITSFSPRSSNIDEEATKSAELTNSSSSDSSKIIADPVINVSTEDNRIEEGNEEDDSDDEQEDEVHPYTGIIPPMIVIDRIDSDSSCVYLEDLDTPRKRVKSVVPSMRFEASSDLIAALNDRTKPFDPATFSTFIESNTPVAAEGGEEKVGVDDLGIDGAGSSFNMFSSADDDDDDNSSKTSNPDNSDALFDRLRKGFANENVDDAFNTTTRLDLRSRNPFNVPLMARPPRVPSEGSGPNRSSPRSANTSPVLARDKSSRSSDGYSSDDTASKERSSKKDAPSFLHSLWSKSPHNRNYSSGPKSDTSGESNKRWRPHKRNSSKGSYGTLTSLEGEGSILTFHAPKGQLGLVIECSTETAPIIASVKDYSPLLDQVLPGDKIVMIDSTSTGRMGMPEVMSLLEGKSNRATSVRLKVFRAHDGIDGILANQVRSPTVSHLSFDGTGSLGTMSDQESPSHHHARGLSSHSLHQLSHQPSFAGIKRSHSEAEINRNPE